MLILLLYVLGIWEWREELFSKDCAGNQREMKPWTLVPGVPQQQDPQQLQQVLPVFPILSCWWLLQISAFYSERTCKALSGATTLSCCLKLCCVLEETSFPPSLATCSIFSCSITGNQLIQSCIKLFSQQLHPIQNSYFLRFIPRVMVNTCLFLNLLRVSGIPRLFQI